MNIAIVAPSPYQFVMGGAEYFLLGLQRWINENTPHYCELIKIPTRETSLLELVKAYRQHAQIDLGGFDRVVSVKYPSWMVQHPNQAVYMLHKLRGLYDTYHFMGEPLDVMWDEQTYWLRDELRLLSNKLPHDNEPVINLLDSIESALLSGRITSQFARFPGPFARRLVHELDHFAMQPGRIRSYATMSRTVAERTNYFSPEISCQILPPPPRLEGFYCSGDDYLFTVSRLDSPKRIDLLIMSMQHVKANVPFFIAGAGPEEARLKLLAADDKRIRFLGQLTDQQLLDAYANALAVLFVPYEEDYGLVTIEAMRSAKPVLTATDSGGVTELVRNGETGFICSPDPVSIAARIEDFCSDRRQTRRMGHDAQLSVADINWRPLAEFALGKPLPMARVAHSQMHSKRPKAVVVLTFGVTPPRGGGQARVFHLYKMLAQKMDISLVCLCETGTESVRQKVAPGLYEIRVPKTEQHQQEENEISRSVNWVPITDIVASSLIEKTPEYLARLDDECAGADIVIASHPYLSSLLRERYPHLSFWFEAHNVELTLKRSILSAGSGTDSLLGLIENEERHAWLEAQVVYACTQQDLDQLTQIYGPTRATTIVVPNGFAEDEIRYMPPNEREALKGALGIGKQSLVVFLGSWHGPNLEAVERILTFADAIPHALFMVVGSAGLYFRNRTFPQNVKLIGIVDEKEKQVILGAADLAINPMISGSGSNLKILDYFASGVPVLSTKFGMRGLDARPGEHYIEADIEIFLPSLVDALLNNEKLPAMSIAANKLAKDRYSWKIIGEQFCLNLNI